MVFSLSVLIVQITMAVRIPCCQTGVKSEEPFLAYPPPDMELVGWRDPFIFEFMGKRGEHKEWGMLMGSGIKGKGGAVMIYRSNQLRSGVPAFLRSLA